METVISRAILGRFAFPTYVLEDSTIDGFLQPEGFTIYRPGSQHSPVDVNNRFNIFDGMDNKDILSMSKHYRNTPYEGLKAAANNLQPDIKLMALKAICKEYSNYTIFRFEISDRHTKSLETAIQEVKHFAAQARGFKQLYFSPIQKHFFDWSRNELLDIIADADTADHPFRMIHTRNDWALLGDKIEIYYQAWLLLSENHQLLNQESLEEVTQETYAESLDRLDIDMCEEAIRQALIFYHGRDPDFDKYPI